MLPLNTMLLEVLCHLIGHVLSTLVISKHLDLSFKSGLCPGFVLFEARECVTLVLHQIYSVQPGAHVKKEDPVFV